MRSTIVTLLTVWSIIPTAFIDDLLWKKSLLFELLCPQPQKIKHWCFLVYLHFFSVLAPAFSVNKVYSLFRLAAETCVSVSILIQSISMGSMSYSVRRRCSLCAWRLPEYLQTALCAISAWDCAIYCNLRVCAWQSVHACVCLQESAWMRNCIPWAASYNVSGGDGGELESPVLPKSKLTRKWWGLLYLLSGLGGQRGGRGREWETGQGETQGGGREKERWRRRRRRGGGGEGQPGFLFDL